MPDIRSHGLLNAKPATPNYISVILECGFVVLENDVILTSQIALVNCRRVVAGDVVIFREGANADDVSVGRVYLHFQHGDTVCLCIARWRFVSRDDIALKYEVDDRIAAIRTHGIKDSLVYSAAEVGQISHCLLTCMHRQFIFH